MTLRKSLSSNKKRTSKQPSIPKRDLTFLLEIGTEELPSPFFPKALHSLELLAKQMFESSRLRNDSLQTFGTSRRLALLVTGVQPKQDPFGEEVFGPPKAVAYDSAGNPTKAAEGFAKSQGVPVDWLKVKETPKGQYVYVDKQEDGLPAKRVLADAIPQLLAQITFPKVMRWNDSRVKFGRPIRWIAALLGDQPLQFAFAGIPSGPWTRGHRFKRVRGIKPGEGIRVAHANAYVKTMKRVGVLVDPDDRRKLITQQIDALAKAAKGRVDPQYKDALIEEAVWGVEFPHAILGSFENEFLEIPQPVLISSMKEHQGYFSLVSRENLLLPKFIAVTNMPWGNTRLMTKGNERVLSARLSDAQYFFREDSKHPLHEKIPALAGIIFHQRLGTVRQKVDRLHDLAGWLAVHVGREDLQDVCQRAAVLSKADLTTGMVGEFPTLQGVMGEEYARHDGELEEVCRAVGEQYLPRFPDDQLPATLPGALLALADRCDTIVCFFSAGMAPSGSEDPLGLRRAAYGAVRIVTEIPLRLNLVAVVGQMMRILEKQGMGYGNPQTGTEILNFLLDRLRFFGGQKFGFREDVMEAVSGLPHEDDCDLADLLARMQALQAIAHQPDFDLLMVGFKRAHRIVEKEQWTGRQVLSERFVHHSEQQLSQVLELVRQRVNDAVSERNYEKALQDLLDLKSPIDDFFEAVMVNDPDPEARANRLSLLKTVDDLFLAVADFSRLQLATG